MSPFDQESPRLRRVLGRVDLRDLGDPLVEIGLFAGASDLPDVERRLREQVGQEVDAVLALTEEFDAFDVIELMRQRELPISPVLGLDPSFDGSGAAIEVVTLVLLSRGERKPSSTPREDTRPNQAIAELHDRAKRLLRLAVYRAKALEFMRGRDPVARLSAEYQSYLVGVRALQYESIQAEHERMLFDRPEIDLVLRTYLGFTYLEFVAVREAVQHRYSDIVTSLRDITGDIFMTANTEGREPTPEESEILRRSLIDWMFLPPNEQPSPPLTSPSTASWISASLSVCSRASVSTSTRASTPPSVSPTSSTPETRLRGEASCVPTANTC